jgi:hypothetical protein
MWINPTFIDTVTTANGAELVIERRQYPNEPTSDSNPLIKVIAADVALRRTASFILHADAVARLRSFSEWDFSGQWPESDRAPMHWKHPSYEILERNRNFDVEACLQDLIGGRRTPFPDAGGMHDFLWFGMMREPRCEASVITQPNPRLVGTLEVVGGKYRFVPGSEHYIAVEDMKNHARTAYEPTVAHARGLLLNEAVAARQAQNEERDAGLAATIAANRIATRAALLARAQAIYPERGYT